MAGTSQNWWFHECNGITHFLIIESGRNKSAVIVLLMGWKYTLPDNLKRQEQVSLDGAANENGTTHFLTIENGAINLLLIKWE